MLELFLLAQAQPQVNAEVYLLKVASVCKAADDFWKADEEGTNSFMGYNLVVENSLQQPGVYKLPVTFASVSVQNVFRCTSKPERYYGVPTPNYVTCNFYVPFNLSKGIQQDFSNLNR